MHRIQGRPHIYQSSQSEMLVTTLDDSARTVGCLNRRRNTMLNTHLKLAAAALLASVAFVGSAHAQVVGESSNTAKVKIDESTVNGGPHSSGEVGINVPALTSTQYIDFLGLQNVLGTDGNGVTTFTATTTDVDDHSTYGRFDFAKVGSYDLYFGEWSQTGSATAGDHTVYYGGTGATSSGNMPSSGSANYTVKGISNYASSGTPLSGTFTANFGAGELTGSIQNSALKIDIGTADIFGSAIAGFGTATATNPSTTATLASNGDVSGQFFGSAAQALAGIVSFSSNQYDTAFGGEN